MKARVIRTGLVNIEDETQVLVAIEETLGPITRTVEELEFSISGRYKGYSLHLQYAIEQALIAAGYDLEAIPMPTDTPDLEPPPNLAIPPAVSL